MFKVRLKDMLSILSSALQTIHVYQTQGTTIIDRTIK